MAQYKPFVVSNTARTDVLRLEDLHHLFPPTANIASKGVSTPLRGRNSGNTPSNSPGRGQSHNHVVAEASHLHQELFKNHNVRYAASLATMPANATIALITCGTLILGRQATLLEMNTLSDHLPYTGADQVIIGNSSGLKIRFYRL